MSNPAATTIPEWVALAAFAQPHGVSGRVKVKSFTDPIDDFASYPLLTDEKGIAYKLKITGHTQGLAIVTVEGVTDRNQAELLRGKKIGVARTALPEIKEENRFYIDDLIGIKVFDLQGQPFGTVINVTNYGAGDILDIRLIDGREEMFAFTHVTFPTVDMNQRRITIDPPVILGDKKDEMRP